MKIATTRMKALSLLCLAIYFLAQNALGGDVDTCSAGGEGCGIVSVIDRNLIVHNPSYTSILQEEFRYGTDVHTNRFAHETLGYVTPWNNHGYDTAKIFRQKFTYISPVWYQIRHGEQRNPILTGGHDVDAGWIKAVRGESNAPFIVPRFMFEMNSLSSQEAKSIIKLIRNEVKERNFDGITLEIPVIDVTIDFISNLGKSLQKDGRILIAVLPTSQRNGDLSTPLHHIKKLLPSVHRFSVNAYDYSSNGPNAPLPWLQSTLKALEILGESSKFLMGLAFYGYDTQNAIVASQYRELLAEHRPHIQWDEVAQECFFKYNEDRMVYYPCLQSIQDRLNLYTASNVGTAIWDIGQGLDYFFDLL